jgi:hypothetical protein
LGGGEIMPSRGYLEGGSYDGGGDPIPRTIITSGGGGAQAVATNPALVTVTGGLTGVESFLLVPMYDPDTKEFYFGVFDYTNFDTESACEYRFRQEEVLKGRLITVSRVRLQYRNLGKATVTAFIKVAPDSTDKTNVNNPCTIKIGTNNPDGEIYTTFLIWLLRGKDRNLLSPAKPILGRFVLLVQVL